MISKINPLMSRSRRSSPAVVPRIGTNSGRIYKRKRKFQFKKIKIKYLLKNLLIFVSCLIVVRVTICKDQLQISKEIFRALVLNHIQFVLDGSKVHWVLDYPMVVWSLDQIQEKKSIISIHMEVIRYYLKNYTSAFVTGLRKGQLSI